MTGCDGCARGIHGEEKSSQGKCLCLFFVVIFLVGAVRGKTGADLHVYIYNGF
jgi:hypothetical protein